MSQTNEYVRQHLLSIKQRFQEAPDGTLVFCWGRGILSDNIRFFQKIESIESLRRVSTKRNISLSFDMPTHVEVKVDRNHNVSAEAKGVSLMDFDRLLKKNIGLALAKPIIESRADKDWQIRARQYLLSKVGTTPYDFLTNYSYIRRIVCWLFSWALPKKEHWKVAEACSELSSRIFLLKGGDKFFDVDEEPHQLSPEEMWMKVQKERYMEIEILVNPKDIVPKKSKHKRSGIYVDLLKLEF